MPSNTRDIDIVYACPGLKDRSASYINAMAKMEFTANYVDTMLKKFFKIEIALPLIVVTFLFINYASSKRQQPFPPFILN
jgi:hypothetical protein